MLCFFCDNLKSMISQKDVEHIAKLARIELTEKEKEKFSNELSLILDYINQLNEVDTKDVEPTSQVTGISNALRSDESVNDLNNQDKIIKGFPQRKETLLKVKAILEK